MSYRDAPVAIISIAQHARPNVIGHMLDSRAQLIACSNVVVMTLSSKRPSSQPISTSSVLWSPRPGPRGPGIAPAIPGPLGPGRGGMNYVAGAGSAAAADV